MDPRPPRVRPRAVEGQGDFRHRPPRRLRPARGVSCVPRDAGGVVTTRIRREGRRLTVDLTPLLEDRGHLTGFDGAALRAPRVLKAVFGIMPGDPPIKFWQ